MTNSAVINFRSNPQSKIRVERLAKLTKRPASFYYNYLLDEYLDDLEDLFLAEEVIKNVRSGKERTYSLAEVESELGL
ncbi:CopG family transcriptional regulator [Treponema sp. Marseille-Q3903]|uniref:type II toxin-antitoxin system RelB family antitoxin n=1 Tax=Treponema sp. Marseille-Q3903 TaxID=2766703 RepID=UPI0016525289|nr:CopG family transcriptional regulator [Treponema sp. Marseille-Q3903]MBC6712425.1 CopG family transcriptional regulator [Treponema sp. Marseille-Q3903]